MKQFHVVSLSNYLKELNLKKKQIMQIDTKEKKNYK